MASTFVLAIDQGTTSSRAIVFDAQMHIRSVAQKEYPQFYPQDGWVEQDAETIWRDTLEMCRQVIDKAQITAKDIASIGITNQRETIILWDRNTGKPVTRTIVWQDRRTAAACEAMKKQGVEAEVTQKTGLRIDPYFSATKLQWMLDHCEGARAAAEEGKLAAGTVDCFLLWHLTGGKLHATDATNASRTLLYNTATHAWDEDLLKVFNIPKALLPEVRDNISDYGVTAEGLFDHSIPIRAMIGDQQAATVGQACFAPGMIKSTYGTGCFAVLNTGEKRILSAHQLLSTIAYQVDGKTTYALEGSIFIAGAAVKWLRDQLGLIASAKETGELAQSVSSAQGVYFVTAFAGLGAPYWDPYARAAILGMTLDTKRAHVVRAALEAVVYQTRDLLEALKADMAQAGLDNGLSTLRVDGGMVANDWLCQHLADNLQLPVERPPLVETTALGAAFFAAIGAGLHNGLEDIAASWRSEANFKPATSSAEADEAYRGWKKAVQTVQGYGHGE